MKKKTTWAATVVKKQLQTCCKHQAFSLETTERDDTSQGIGSPSRVIHISSPLKEASYNPVLQRHKSFNVSHARSLLTTPEPLTPFRKSVESAIPLCRSSTFKSGKLQNVKPSPGGTPRELVTMGVPSKGKVLHKSGPLPVLQHLFRGSLQGGLISSPLNVKKHLSGPLMTVPRKPLSGAPSPKQTFLGGPSPQRLSRVKFSPTPHEIAASRKLSDMIAEEDAPKAKQIAPANKVKKELASVLERKGSRESGRASKTECYPAVVKSATAKTVTEAVANELASRENEDARVLRCKNLNVREESAEKSDAVDCLEKDYIAAAVKIQASFRGHQTRDKLAGEVRGSCNPSEEATEEVEEAPSISTQMSRTDPQKQQRNPPPRANRGWNGSIRSAQDHQALMRSREEAALKRERAMEYALSRQRWKATGSRPAKGPVWCTDDRLPDKPGWVRSWLDRATRMSAQTSQNRVFDDDFVQNEPQSESLSMKSTVGMCTTDIGSPEVNLGWPLSLRQQHAAGLLQANAPILEPLELQTETLTPPKPRQRTESKCMDGERGEFSCSADSGVVSIITSEESPFEALSPRNEAHEIEESSGRHHGHDTELESVGSCEGPAATINKVQSPVVASKPRLQQAAQHKLSNSNSLKEGAKRDRLFALRPHSQVSVALSDGNSADTTAASVQRPVWR